MNLPKAPSPLPLPGAAAFLALLFVPCLRADWSWQNDKATAAPSEAHLVAEFTFQNNGKAPLTVKDLQFACSCTEYTFKATTADPGKEGILRVYLSPNKRPETLELVTFGSDDATPTPLTIQVLERQQPAQ